MRLSHRFLRLTAILGICLGVLMSAVSGAGAQVPRTISTVASFDPATQSHPGACSQDTLDVSKAVSDLGANGVLGQYASLVGVHATGAALRSGMRETLVVVKVAQSAVTANHGCTTYGLVFPVGSRTLTVGETVGVALPQRLRASICSGPGKGCKQTALDVRTVFPTNCWNLNQGAVKVWVYVRAPKPKPKPKPKPTKPKLETAKPSAHVDFACGTGTAGTSTVTLSNASGASARASFKVDGKSYGPLAAGHSIEVSIPLRSNGELRLLVTSGGQTLVDESVPADPCPAAVPSASAALNCSAGGVVVTLNNGAAATNDASFLVNGTTYGPVAPGASLTVTVTAAPGTVTQLTVSSGSVVLLGGETYTNSCAADPSALAVAVCQQNRFFGGGTLELQLSDGVSATLPANFSVTVTGNTTAGYGPTTVGPVAIGADQTLQLPIDGTGNAITVTVDSGAMHYSQVLTGCPVQQLE
ncbi:MAG: hypothetical protein ACP5H2_10425 [Solirubrobacteraceae bacterium]